MLNRENNSIVIKNEDLEGKLLLLFLIVVCFYAIGAFYVPLLNSFFTADDISWVYFSATKSIGQIFFIPEQYRAINGSNFTPMLGLSYKIDWLLFGMNPKGYFVHNLIAGLFAGAAFFFLVRYYSNTFTGFAGVVLFLLNPLTLSVFSWSAARHYTEGMFFALVSFYLYARKAETGRAPVLSAVFYLLSALCKETYVVLPAVLFLITKGSIAQRVRNTLLFWIALVIYFLWRLWMLQSMGGYQTFMPVDLKSGLFRLIEFMPQHLFGSYRMLFWVIAIFIFLMMSKKIRAVLLAVIAGILLMPIVPVSSLFDIQYTWARYVFHLTVFMIFIGVLWGRENLKQNGWKRASVVIVLITAITLFVIRDNELKTTLYKDSENSRKTTEAFLYSDKKFISAEQPAWFYDGLRDINEYLYGKKIDTMIIPEEKLIKYISEKRRLDILSDGNDIASKAGEFRKNIIKGKLALNGYRIKWKLGPYKEGNYFIIRGRFPGLYNYVSPVKDRGGYLFGEYYPDGRPEVFYLKVVYQSPEGWEGISDEYRIEIPGNTEIKLGLLR